MRNDDGLRHGFNHIIVEMNLDIQRASKTARVRRCTDKHLPEPRLLKHVHFIVCVFWTRKPSVFLVRAGLTNE